VSVRTEESPSGDGELVIEVADRGPGIPEEMLPHVFDRFFKASASRPRSEGSGLGLSIAQENAHIHGGSISARNDPSPEGGAVFTLRLPRETCGGAPGDDYDTDTADGDLEASDGRDGRDEDGRGARGTRGGRGRGKGEDGGRDGR
jgi:two-component system sensor histidine kinase MtrB